MNEQEITQKLFELVHTMSKALVTRDVQTLAALWSDEYLFTTPIGTVLTKQQRLEAIEAGTRPVAALTYSDLNARIYGKTAVVTGRYTETSRTQTTGEQGRLTLVFVEQNDIWRMVAGHNSRIIQ